MRHLQLGVPIPQPHPRHIAQRRQLQPILAHLQRAAQIVRSQSLQPHGPGRPQPHGPGRPQPVGPAAVRPHLHRDSLRLRGVRQVYVAARSAAEVSAAAAEVSAAAAARADRIGPGLRAPLPRAAARSARRAPAVAVGWKGRPHEIAEPPQLMRECVQPLPHAVDLPCARLFALFVRLFALLVWLFVLFVRLFASFVRLFALFERLIRIIRTLVRRTPPTAPHAVQHATDNMQRVSTSRTPSSCASQPRSPVTHRTSPDHPSAQQHARAALTTRGRRGASRVHKTSGRCAHSVRAEYTHSWQTALPRLSHAGPAARHSYRLYEREGEREYRPKPHPYQRMSCTLQSAAACSDPLDRSRQGLRTG